MGQFDTFVAVQVTDEGERDYEFPECLFQLVWYGCLLMPTFIDINISGQIWYKYRVSKKQ